MNSFRFLSVETISDRITEILSEMTGPDRGKQTRLAEIAGCTKALINQLLKNPSQQIGYDYARNIEERLGYRVDWILYGKLPKLKTEKLDVVAGVVSTADISKLIELFGQATDSGRKFILDSASVAEKLDSFQGRRGGATNEQY